MCSFPLFMSMKFRKTNVRHNNHTMIFFYRLPTCQFKFNFLVYHIARAT